MKGDRRNGRNGRKPVFDGDFPDDGASVTETINRIIPDWDGRTITFAGASGELTPEPPAPPRRPQLRHVPVTPPPQPAPAIPVLEWQPDPRHDIIGRETARGWPHLSEIRCAYPAASHPTPIPCGSVHHDGTTGTFRDLRRSALAAGWHLDALGQWACPRCQDNNGQYRTLYPVTNRHPALPKSWPGPSCGVFWPESGRPSHDFWLERPATRHHASAAAALEAEDPAAEFWLQVEAELGVAIRTADNAIHGRHHRAGT